MVFGHARIPIISWMRKEAAESAAHAVQGGEEVTARGRKVSLAIGELVGSHHDTLDEMMQLTLPDLLSHRSPARSRRQCDPAVAGGIVIAARGTARCCSHVLALPPVAGDRGFHRRHPRRHRHAQRLITDHYSSLLGDTDEVALEGTPSPPT